MTSVKVKLVLLQLLTSRKTGQIGIAGEILNFLPTLLLPDFLHTPPYKKIRTVKNVLFYKEMQRGGE